MELVPFIYTRERISLPLAALVFPKRFIGYTFGEAMVFVREYLFLSIYSWVSIHGYLFIGIYS